MQLTMTLGWWIVPVTMLVAAAIVFHIGSKKTGFGGLLEFGVALGLLVAAVASTLVGFLA